MTVEEIYQDRLKFSQGVRAVTTEVLTAYQACFVLVDLFMVTISHTFHALRHPTRVLCST